jgi:hypothetical protein
LVCSFVGIAHCESEVGGSVIWVEVYYFR